MSEYNTPEALKRSHEMEDKLDCFCRQCNCSRHQIIRKIQEQIEEGDRLLKENDEIRKRLEEMGDKSIARYSAADK